MKNLKSTMISATAIASLTVSSFALADSIQSVLPEINYDSSVSVNSSQNQYGPVTISDYIYLAMEKSRTDINVGSNSNSVSVLEDFRNIRDVL